MIDPNARVSIVVLMEDDLLHTADHPFCDDRSCPCHSIDNFEAIWSLKTQLAQGLLTNDEHIRIWRGENV